MSLIKLLNFNLIGDERGSLVSIEEHKDIPFKIKRVYYIFDTQNGVVRGYHAHKNLEQVAICLKGKCEFILDDGRDKESIVLEGETQGLYIGNNIWREMHNFSKDCVLVVFASEFYDESDYIRNYDEFIKRMTQ
jgi:dTDP-4-dehydrorhamnose 3,5-epimerase-like enzyme